MSYGSRSMTDKDDLLFRVKTHIPAYEYDKPIYGKDENGRMIVLSTERAMTTPWTGYTGPYTTVAPARSAATKERRSKEHNRTYNKEGVAWTVELEACMPDWKVME